MIEEIINNWNSYCTEENFIGIGSTRKVYKVSGYVVKINLHPIGNSQSKNELEIFNAMMDKGLHHLFAQTYYVDECISIQKYYEPLEMKGNQTFEIDRSREEERIPNRYQEVLTLLDQEFDSFDLKDSSNYGLNSEGKLVFIDYGMNKTLYEEQWVPSAENGILPQIDYDFCTVCESKKELRMYGDHDRDKRCYSCGKE
ncbi:MULTISPECIES: protein kinase [Pontibacillus]|uniref:Protein kinase n=1 Tax=Pontibacillus chungwhensis TaxID=265426 RepID=A0ABY8V1G8_9BACI|nr:MULTISPECIES: protein kinase [Pontibacillus]MCD5324422.1 protein kinase [Pontibacillus sp. HN14]WIF99283.1 protein kinase [Pontibacillus chungwhensis]